MRFIGLLGLAIALLAGPDRSLLAQAPDLRLIGMIGTSEKAVALFSEGLAEQGWIVGENVRLEVRPEITTPDQARAAAAELIALAPDVLYGLTSFRARALVEATDTIPIVFSNLTDPVGLGLVADLARPGGNVTGHMFIPEVEFGRFLQVFAQAAPHLRTVGYLVDEPTTLPGFIEAMQRAGADLGLDVKVLSARDAADYGPLIEGLGAVPDAGLVVDSSIVLYTRRAAIVEAVNRAGLPAIYFWRAYVESGGLMSYGVDEWEPIRRAGAYAGRILNGEKPGDLPVQASTRFYLTLNRATATELGVAFPRDLVVLADEVFD